ncbi:MAG: NnrS family protein [Sulfitobacter sp.]
MTTHNTKNRRGWQNSAFLSIGLRPLFFMAALWAALAMGLWVAMLSGSIVLPTRFDPVSWHVHEFLFGYLGAVIAGFLLTAVPNWTGRKPLIGAKLAALSALWVLGRLAILFSAVLPLWMVPIADGAFLVLLWCVVLREIVAGQNWRNTPVLALIGVLILANIVFHLEADIRGTAAQGIGLRLGISAALILIAIIGGRIIPSFTRNWLIKRGATKLPTPPMQRIDKVTLLVTGPALLAWTFVPDAFLTGVALILMAVMNVWRLSRWQSLHTVSEPLVWVLHIAYFFIPLGALTTAVAIFHPQIMTQAAAIHVWTTGAIGLMTVGVMTRATLGHTGRSLHAGTATTIFYLALVLSVFTRLCADLAPTERAHLLNASASLWIACFVGVAVVYGPLLLRHQQA